MRSRQVTRGECGERSQLHGSRHCDDDTRSRETAHHRSGRRRGSRRLRKWRVVTQAESATTVSAAAALWHQADEQVMKDAPFIPFQTQLTPLFRSARVHNAIFIPFAEYYDVTQVWLSS